VILLTVTFISRGTFALNLEIDNNAKVDVELDDISSAEIGPEFKKTDLNVIFSVVSPLESFSPPARSPGV
jgi:hypothetical protein